jgi:tRNA(fMet)-specific endonuclease VapC
LTYLLDTNACISHLRSNGKSAISTRLLQCMPNDVVLCSIVKAELVYGAERSNNPLQNKEQIAKLFGVFASLPFDDRAAECYGHVRAKLASLGLTIGPNDLLIASIALANNITLVTHNVSEFAQIISLRIEDWE